MPNAERNTPCNTYDIGRHLPVSGAVEAGEFEHLLKGNAMDLQTLRRANVQRCEQSFHPLDAWSPLEWSGAMTGEAGEAANLAKKIKRHETSKYTSKHDVDELRMQLAEELADVVIYADLLAARCGIDLERAIVGKFNKTSKTVGSDITLELEPA